MPSDSGAALAAPARNRLTIVVVLATCWVPLLVAAVALASRGWTPVGEFAQAELRVRDFWEHPPSLGAVARLRTESGVSSHPGPAAWWAMYPTYAVLGRSAVALSTAVAITAGAWMTAALLVAWRRGGDVLAVLLGFALLATMAGVGPSVFLEPWNPWFALMPFLALMLSTWAVCVGARWPVVLAAAAGTYCVQAHLGYAPLVALLGVLALLGLWHRGPRRDGDWKPLVGPLAATLAVSGLMWLPPLLEQVTGDPGNIGLMVSAYRQQSDAEPELGLLGAAKLVGGYLDPRSAGLVLTDAVPTGRGVSAGSVVMVLGWAAAAVLAFRERRTARMWGPATLQLVAAVALIGAWLAASRIPGEVFGYLVLWLPAVVAVAAVATLWTFWTAAVGTRNPGAGSRDAPERLPGVRLVAGTLLAAASVGTAISFSEPMTPGGILSDTTDSLVPAVADELLDRGAEELYVVRWEDPANFGALGTAVLSELERSGVGVGVDERLSTEMRPHRVLGAGEATAALWVVSGEGIERWRELPGATEVALVDPRPQQDRLHQEELERRIRRELLDSGLPELAEDLGENYWAVRSNPRVGPDVDALIDSYIEIGLPTAVFLAPPSLAQPVPG